MPPENIEHERKPESDIMIGYVKAIPGALEKAKVVTDGLGGEEIARKGKQQGISKKMQNIRGLTLFILIAVVVIELILAANLSTGVTRLDIEQLKVMTAQMSWLAIIDKLLIVALFATIVFEKRE
ncbi:MAG: hypothetical protein ACFFEF_16895 [Candidatus Thorarchaeota archaeon]